MIFERVRNVFRQLFVLGDKLDTLNKYLVLYNWGLTNYELVNINPLCRNPRRYWSQSNEDGIIQNILDRIPGYFPKTFLEIGVGNGLENNTIALLARNYRGIWVDSSPIPGISPNAQLHFINSFVTNENISQIVQESLTFLGEKDPDISVISIDVDGNDY